MIADLLPSLLSAGGLGAITKIAAGFVSHIMAARREKREFKHKERIVRDAHKIESFQAFYGGGDKDALMWTLGTRRMLALWLGLVFGVIMVLCTLWPTVQILVLEPRPPTTHEFLWGAYTHTSTRNDTIIVTTGALAWNGLHFITFALSVYFTPGGKK